LHQLEYAQRFADTDYRPGNRNIRLDDATTTAFPTGAAGFGTL